MQPFLMFQGGHAEKAMNFYVSLFDDGEVFEVTRWQKGEQGAEGSIKLARFRAAGQSVLASDSPVKHAFDFTPSFPSSSTARRTRSRGGFSPNCRMVAR